MRPTRSRPRVSGAFGATISPALGCAASQSPPAAIIMNATPRKRATANDEDLRCADVHRTADDGRRDRHAVLQLHQLDVEPSLLVETQLLGVVRRSAWLGIRQADSERGRVLRERNPREPST